MKIIFNTARVVGGTLLVLGLALAGQSRSKGPLRVVGSKNFTEQEVLGEVMAGLLESRGFSVERRLNLGGTTLCHEALRTGQVDLYVEYTGTALTEVLKLPSQSDAAAVLEKVRAAYARLGITVAEPLGFNNSFALVMRRVDAEGRGITRISDLVRHAATIRVGLSGEFLERQDGMRGLNAAYGFAFALPPREMDLGLLYRALTEGRVDLAVGSATDGLIAALDLVVLEDDRGYFPPYDAVPLVRTASLLAHPGLAAALHALAGRIDAPTMRRLNQAVDQEHREPRAVAKEFLRALEPESPRVGRP